jgi:hypothetical protein
MRNVRAFQLLVGACLVFALVSLSGCREIVEQTSVFAENTQLPSMKLPDTIQYVHNSDMLVITWFEHPFSGYYDKNKWLEKPFSGHYDRLALHSDGSFGHWLVTANWGARRAGWGHLAEGQLEEIRAILETMTEDLLSESPVLIEPSTGSKIITLSFPWEVENYVLSFSEASCPDEFHHLLEAIDVAFERNPENPASFQNLCQQDSGYQEQTQDSTLSDGTPSSSVSLPDLIKQAHGARLFCITWFEQPFAGSYDELSLFANDFIGYYRLTDTSVHKNAKGQLTEREMQEAKAILELMTSTSFTEQPMGETIVSLSFPWKADYHLFTFGDSNCPANLHRLLEIVDVAFRRDSPGFDFQNPCQEE